MSYFVRKDSLKNLASKELGWDIQDGSHSSVEDARAAVMIYKKHKVAWENEVPVLMSTLLPDVTDEWCLFALCCALLLCWQSS